MGCSQVTDLYLVCVIGGKGEVDLWYLLGIGACDCVRKVNGCLETLDSNVFLFFGLLRACISSPHFVVWVCELLSEMNPSFYSLMYM